MKIWNQNILDRQPRPDMSRGCICGIGLQAERGGGKGRPALAPVLVEAFAQVAPRTRLVAADTAAAFEVDAV
ncbi:hypothetical protein D9M70_640080 [compost metagenome]